MDQLRQEVVLYFLKLPNQPSFEDLSKGWRLVLDGPPQPTQSSSDASSVQSTLMNTGDLIFFDQLLSGAGEIEGLRVVWAEEDDNTTKLLPMGIEYVEWPQIVLDYWQDKQQSLQSMYEGPLHVLYEHQHVCMEDALGGGDLQEFWNTPVVQRRRRVQQEYDGYYDIHLTQCLLEKKVTSTSSLAS